MDGGYEGDRGYTGDCMKVALVKRGIAVEAARQCAKDGKEWRALVHM